MCVYVVDIVKTKSRAFNSPSDCTHLTFTVGTGSGNVVSVTAYTRTENFTVNLCASFNSVFVAFDYKNARTLAERDTCAVIERGTGVFVKRMESVETAECK